MAAVMNPAPAYDFLSKPPPCIPLPPPPASRKRSTTFNNIANWAATVQPGSPATPSPSPRRAVHRRPSNASSRRRPSITHCRARSGSTSFLNIVDTPTPSVKDFDLTILGYTSVFVELPCTPVTPAVHRSPASPQKSVARKPTTPALKRFRSLTTLRRPRSKSTTTAPAMPPPPLPKKAKPYPPPLANDLALAQLLGGGTLDAHAPATAHRDATGAIWTDADEAAEYQALLADSSKSGTATWIPFDPTSSPMSTRSIGSGGSSDPEAHSPVRPIDAEARAGFAPAPMSLAARRRRREFALDAAAFAVPPLALPKSPVPKSPSSPSPRARRPRGAARRRPAPLTLAKPRLAGYAATNSPDVHAARREFLDDSFRPPVPPKDDVVVSGVARVAPSLKRRRSRMGIRGLFTLGK